MQVFRRVGLALVAALMMSTALLAPGDALAPSQRAAFGLAATPNPAVAGETVALSGRLSSRVARPIVLQQYLTGAWRRVRAARSASTGRFSFTVRAPAATRTYRVVAPGTRISGRRYAALRSATRAVRVVPQTGTLAAPATAVTAKSFLITMTFTPARDRRWVDIEELDHGVWTDFDSYHMDADGVSRMSIRFDGPGTYQLRARARSHHGIPAFTTAAATINVTMPPADRLMRISNGSTGNAPANGARHIGSSRDGRYVLWNRDHNGDGAYLLWDRETRISTAVPAPPAPAAGATARFQDASSDLRWVVVQTSEQVDGIDIFELFLWDRELRTATLITRGQGGARPDGYSSNSSISDDGRFVAFWSLADNLVAADPNPHHPDAFVWDRDTGAIAAVSRPFVGEINQDPTAPEISPDGDFVYYGASAHTVDPSRDGSSATVRWARATGVSSLVELPGSTYEPGVGMPEEPMSADGRWMALYARNAVTHLPVAVVWDSVAGTVEEVPEVDSPAADGTKLPLHLTGISADGSTVTGTVEASRYDPARSFLYDLSYVYVWTRGTAAPVLATRSRDGSWSRGMSDKGVLSGSGRYLTFMSVADDLVAGSDDNFLPDVFTWDRDGTP